MRLEKLINFIIGLIFFNNFYYLGFFVGIDYKIVILVSGFVSFLFFLKAMILVKNSIRKVLIDSSSTRFIWSTTIISCLFLAINQFSQKDFDSNDIIRILFLFFYFSWTSIKYGDEINFRKYIILISAISIIIYLPIIFFEYNFPGVFGLIFKEENRYDEDNWLRRVGATIKDPNGFACLIICYSFFLYYYYFKLQKKIWLALYILLLTYIINLTGSRQGLILLITLVFYIFIDLKLSLLRKISLAVISLLLLVVFLINSTIKSEVESQSLLTRVLTSDSKAESSSVSRVNSIFEGINYSFKNFYFLYGAGSFLFASSWSKSHPELGDVPPHNTFFFIFIQYGIFSFFIFFSFLIFLRKIFTLKLYIIGILFFLIISFLPSILYTLTGLILLWFVDILSFQKHQKNQNSNLLNPISN